MFAKQRVSFVIQENNGTSIVVGGKTFMYFGGTNYLSIAHRPELLSAASEAFYVYGFSAGASRLTSGETFQLLELEEDLADFAGGESALMLPSGYVSNLAVVDALDEKVDLWVVQSEAHRSIISALRQSTKPIKTASKHELDEVLSARRQKETIGVFLEPIQPLTGELIDVAAIARQLQPQDFLILDEAHSFGVLGNRGRGAAEHFHIQDNCFLVRTGTFSKALGAQGGFVISSGDVIAAVIQKSGTYRASTPLSPVLVAASQAALGLLRQEPETTINKLKTNIALMNAHLFRKGIQHSNDVPIYNLCGLSRLIEMEAALTKAGVFVPPVGKYFAGAGEIGVRWTMQANHSPEQINLLGAVLHEYV